MSSITVSTENHYGIITIRRLVQSDYDNLRNYFRNVYKNNPLLLDKQYFDWEYLDRFEDSQVYNFWIAIDSSLNIVGWIGASRFYYNENGQCANSCWVQLWHSECNDATGLKLLLELKNSFKNTFFAGFTKKAERIYDALGYDIYEFSRLLHIIDYDIVSNIFGLTLSNNDIGVIEECNQKADEEVRNMKPNNLMSKKSVGSYIKKNKTVLRNNMSPVCYLSDYLLWRYEYIPHHNYQLINFSDNNFVIYRNNKIDGTDFYVMKILEWHGSTSESMVSMVIHEARKTDAVMIEFYTLDDSGLDRFGFFKDSNLSEKIPNMFNPVNKSNTAKFSSNIVFNNNLPGFTFGVSDLDRNKSGF